MDQENKIITPTTDNQENQPSVPNQESVSSTFQELHSNIEVENKAVLKMSDNNRSINHMAFILLMIALFISLVIIFTLWQFSNSTRSYSTAVLYESYGDIVTLVMTALFGMYFAFITAHPTRTIIKDQLDQTNKGSNGLGGRILWIAGIIVGLLLGVLPGIILFILFYRAQSKKNKVLRQEASLLMTNIATQSFMLKPIKISSIIAAFFIGLVPGFVWMLIITYPLSKRSCELSGSKYC
jgi:heme/copper-type cytochrome/quinol oxidase subunit 2